MKVTETELLRLVGEGEICRVRSALRELYEENKELRKELRKYDKIEYAKVIERQRKYWKGLLSKWRRRNML